ncbi:uncharacterized protein LOC123503593 [Portunus trituberculatus]|uniref:uncharacterized protein LOC123503593 n=1 Tax=Portunus trituberculatus TaxID=210409 RepID=UPI001E1CFA78|nr:uncharacterized protein LOC123503593 [Portunus trituberculatus]XP_045109430.1 uncharacterized protein LOC123503593 [Portunus trituberculatus]
MPFFKPPKNPRAASEVTKQWLEYVLSQYESRTSRKSIVEVDSFEINPGCGKCENFNSEVIRIEAEAQVTPTGGTPSPVHYSFIVKFIPGNEFEQESTKWIGAPKRELLVLSEILPALNTFQKERGGGRYPINAPEYVYGVCTSGEYVLMMQDLREAGYHVGDKRRGLTLSQLKAAVRDLAHLHAVSYAFSLTHDFRTKYPDFKETGLTDSIISTFVRVVIEGLHDALKANESKFPDLVEAIASNKDKILNDIEEFSLSKRQKPLVCLSHGDFWTNNVMFKYNEEGSVDGFMMIDWGNVGWRNPMFDLQYLMHTSTQKATRRDHLKEVQTLYYEAFTSAAASLDAPLRHWRFEDFLAEYQKSAAASKLFCVFVNLITLSEHGRIFNQGTLTTGFSSWLRVKMTKITALIPNRLISTMTYPFMKKAMQIYFDDLASMSNPEMTTRIIDLVTEAFENFVVEP